MTSWSNLVVTILTSLGGASMVSFLLVKTQRRKINAESAAIQAQTEINLSAESRQWLADANRRATVAEAKADRLENRVRLLERHIDQLEEALRRGWGADPAAPADAALAGTAARSRHLR